MSGKYRHEIKYVCNDVQLKLLENRIRCMMRKDSHVDKNGEYVVRSVYFDDYTRRCYYENENGVVPREKFRIRIYNNSDNRISLERKIKKNNMTQKESCQLSKDACLEMLRGNFLSDYRGQSELLDKWINLRDTRLLRPVVLIEYVRIPYVYRLGNVRITFDRNITASSQFENLFHTHILKIPILPTKFSVLEVKYDDFLPDSIYQLLDDGYLRQSTFSKFYLGCKALEGGLENVI